MVIQHLVSPTRAAVLLVVVLLLMVRASNQSTPTDTTKDHDNTTYEPVDDLTLPADAKQIRWALAAYDYLTNESCKEAVFTSERECRAVQRRGPHQMNVYLAGPSRYGRLRAVLPDGGLHKTGAHDAVLVLDPYPDANFGHLLLAFYVELGVTQTWCHLEGGRYLGKSPDLKYPVIQMSYISCSTRIYR
ncbi:hypothetical protein LSH36_182g05017 [Paralvinella palmiformis]|uniref:Uncharacterized protein n=1 Tax=Paralvinella palmiformis TaxID=53620 RepID=A0AAD9N8D5_9ANNE|nr:hypothetical protein LSH36_182g05017 [Paralvinella palmiformis]